MKLNDIGSQEQSWWGGRFKTISLSLEKERAKTTGNCTIGKRFAEMAVSSCSVVDGDPKESPPEASTRRREDLAGFNPSTAPLSLLRLLGVGGVQSSHHPMAGPDKRHRFPRVLAG